MTAEAGRRLFFALWPDAAVAAALYAAARQAHRTCGGRLTRRDTLHMTLAFLGDVAAARLDQALAAAEKVGAGDTAPCVLTIDRIECWRHNHIVWAGGSRMPAELPALADALAAALRERGFRIESRPFVAHATLLRQAYCAAGLALAAPFAWPVGDFVLAESKLGGAGASYDILGRWPLSPPLGGVALQCARPAISWHGVGMGKQGDPPNDD
ncbi:MAG: RNA 2',3'-cyclic phosphodiesterase [Sulfurisoma sp.]|nr:RNA 2',3'-cyclic phosphodiesterase [Sulfurisoma sp.]